MKLLLVIFVSLVAVVYGAAIDPVHALVQRELNVTTPADPDTQLYTYQLPDGRRKIDFVVDGVFEGSLIETTDGGAKAYDAEGNEIPLDELTDDDGTVDKRQSRWQLIARLGRILARWGSRAWSFFKCVGYGSALRCGDEFLRCAQGGDAPWMCLEGIACIGNQARICR